VSAQADVWLHTVKCAAHNTETSVEGFSVLTTSEMGFKHTGAYSAALKQ
jgi:hypothetical protein